MLARVDGDALNQAVGRWLSDRHSTAGGLRALAVDGKGLRGAAKAKCRKSTDEHASARGNLSSTS
ncbi:hypothetical protein ACFTXM_34330 [Streptomyces sp. NPDC056930]|uniref:hypothetical protein n=1 Tax=Streptomyces sp. NPDC056930 TaxID=3345967 RepID=UPI003645C90C